MRFEPSALLIRGVLVLSAGLVGYSLLAIALHFPACFGFLSLGYAYRRMTRWRGGGDAYGSARSSSIGELWRGGLLGHDGLILGTCGYMGRPTRRQGVRALFSFLPSPIACRLFLAAFFGTKWLEK